MFKKMFDWFRQFVEISEPDIETAKKINTLDLKKANEVINSTRKKRSKKTSDD